MSKNSGLPKGSPHTGHALQLSVYFPTTTHVVKNEYLLYTYDSFIADTGGYLGLLLGQRQDVVNANVC